MTDGGAGMTEGGAGMTDGGAGVTDHLILRGGDGRGKYEHTLGSRFAQGDSSSGRWKTSAKVSRNCFSEMANLLALSLRSESAAPKRLRSSSAV